MGAEPNNIIENIGGDWPPELFEKIFRDLEDLTAATALTDIMKIMSALDGTQHSAAMSKLKGKFLIIDLTGAENLVEFSHIARCASKIVCESNMIKTEYSKLTQILEESKAIRKILAVDNDVSISDIEGSLKCCTDVIFCCDSITSLQQGPVKELISAIARVAKDTGTEPKHLILDFPKSSLTFWNNNWLGIFDQVFVSNLCEYSGYIPISIPAVNQIRLYFGMLDNILKNILLSATFVGKCNCYECSEGCSEYCERPNNPQVSYNNKSFTRQKDLWINKLRFYFPDVTQVKFVQNSSTGGSGETYNNVDFSRERLVILKKCGCKIEDVFQFYSLANCKFPQLDFFGGHFFNFKNDTGNTTNLRECIQLLTEISSGKKDNVSSTACKIEPFPENTKESELMNWIVDEFTVNSSNRDSHNKYVAPWFEINIGSLEFLTVRPLILEEMSAMIIKGFCLPNLKEFSLKGNRSIGGSVPPKSPLSDAKNQPSPVKVDTPKNPTESGDFMKWSEVDTLNELGFNLMHPILFSSLNNLSNCKDLKILVPPEKRPNFLFNVKNLKEVLPNLDLKANFPSFLGEEQIQIII